MSATDKRKVGRYFSRKIPLSETRALNADERRQFERIRRRSVGRPKIGKGAKVIAVTLEKGFLERVDAFAKRHDLKRAEMITLGLRLMMSERQPG